MSRVRRILFKSFRACSFKSATGFHSHPQVCPYLVPLGIQSMYLYGSALWFFLDVVRRVQLTCDGATSCGLCMDPPRGPSGVPPYEPGRRAANSASSQIVREQWAFSDRAISYIESIKIQRWLISNTTYPHPEYREVQIDHKSLHRWSIFVSCLHFAGVCLIPTMISHFRRNYTLKRDDRMIFEKKKLLHR